MSAKRLSAILTVLSVFLFTSLAAPDVQATTYNFTTFDGPGAIGTEPASINASGQVAGTYSDGSRSHGFVYSNGTFTALDVPGGTETRATSINASGQVTGYYWDGSGEHGFVYDGMFTPFYSPGFIEPMSINDSGQVAGDYRDGSGGSHGFVYGGGTFTILDVPDATNTIATSINASGQVTGYYYHSSGGSHGFVYGGGAFTTLNVPGATDTYARSINASGQVTGYYYHDGLRGAHSFVYSGGTYTPLNVPGAIDTNASSINASGQITGTCCNIINGGGWYDDCHGFVYSDGAFTTLDVPGATNAGAISINASGQVAGLYRDRSGVDHGFIATPVCVTPTVTIHTLTTAPNGGFRITGAITLDSIPLCALVLANGQFMFTCGDPLPKGDFDLTVPPDAEGQITLFGFSSGLTPFQQTLGPGSLPASTNANSCATPTVTHTVAAAPRGGFRITGSITLGSDPLCALVLANGQFMFTCGDVLPKGNFDLTVPLDDQGKITLFGFSAGLAPFQQTFTPS